MRTTLDIDDDVLEAAKELARAEGTTAGKVLSDLARRALTAPHLGHSLGLGEGQQTPFEDELWVTFPRRPGVLVTAEHVRRIQDEIDMEDALRAARLARGEPAD
jgi:hypothetical protein